MEKCIQEQRIDSLEDRMKNLENITTDVRLMLAKQNGMQIALMGVVGFISTIGSLLVQFFKG